MPKTEIGQFRKRKWNDIGAVLQIGDLRNRLRGDESFSGDGAGLLGESLVRRSALDPSYQQDSGRKSSADGARNEDIRAKLARYKQERENFEQVRQQFRQKHKEIEQCNYREFKNK